ncbi:UbiA family prenyltransferase [Streptomyces sp. NBC_01443]|uniref:UbiA family prenyltransferase n=1 Tax=Streptomyces sp. NBC_01443 TaxID=2903868 RepID=UPI0022518780|nr:UbiA family prenyltransferase [Streptomyces sp. NBC_01443]MCX4633478.1 UbiA family prenyltransferase [Streptomyces sp. NBC_01443]
MLVLTTAKIRKEIKIAALMACDNVYSTSIPPLLFSLGAAIRYGLGPRDMTEVLALSGAWSVLFLFAFEGVNQFTAPQEDSINKPYRPVPAGLATRSGMGYRGLVYCTAFLGLSALISRGTLWAAVLWLSVFVGYLTLPARCYLITKPAAMLLGVAAQEAGAWSIVHPLDATGWRWSLTIAVMFIFPLPLEDVRDMPGDRAIGRVTLALVAGARPVRIWFTAMMTVWPLTAYLLLFRDSGAGRSNILAVTGLFLVLCWSAGLYVSTKSTQHAYRVGYQLYVAVHVALVASPLILLGSVR